MDKYAKERPLRIARILYEQTDEDHSLTTKQLMCELQKIGIPAHRQTVKSDIQLLQKCGLGIREVKSSQNRYSFINRTFDPDELTLLTDAVASSKFITGAESRELEEKICSLASGYQRPELNRNISCENRAKQENEGIRRIIDTINEAINEDKQISFQYFHYNRNKGRDMENNGDPCIVTPLQLVWNGDFEIEFIVGASSLDGDNISVESITSNGTNSCLAVIQFDTSDYDESNRKSHTMSLGLIEDTSAEYDWAITSISFA